MGKWKGNIDVKKEWNQLKDLDTLEAKEQLQPLISKLQSNALYQFNDEFKHLVDALAKSTNFDEFNELWDEIYDWADNNHVWINTQF